ncbi:hypothetical protein D3C87_1439380 [compost metagenome]
MLQQLTVLVADEKLVERGLASCNRFHQKMLIDRLCKKVDDAGLECATACFHVAVSRDHDGRPADAEILKLLQKLQSADGRHPEIEEHDSRFRLFHMGEQVGGIREGRDLFAVGGEQKRHGLSYREVVVDEVDHAGSPSGRRMTKVAPPLLCASRLPFMRSISRDDRGRPRPIPSGFVVKNGSKIRWSEPVSMPGPLSATSMATPSPSRRAVSVMRGEGHLATASAALRTRL